MLSTGALNLLLVYKYLTGECIVLIFLYFDAIVTAKFLKCGPLRQCLLVSFETDFIYLGDVFNIEDGEATLELLWKLGHVLTVR